ncbi:MAG: SusD/RagB family nutrient-binding outer membrane lipoprotein [Chitinophagaceae bacterium]
MITIYKKANVRSYLLAVMLLIFGLAACTKNFEELNTNPDATSVLTPAYMFTLSQYNGAGNILMLLMGTMQYTTSYNDVAGFGSKYVASQYAQSYASFTNGYPNEINQIHQVVETLREDSAGNHVELAIAKIWRVYCFSRLTDLYGDVPYSQAGEGYTSSNYKPAYDRQQAIYSDMLNELSTAIAMLDGNSSTFSSADLLYGGNATQWQKFARSLMLRLGMRMTKVDIAAAEVWVEKATSGDLIMDESDAAAITNYVSSGQTINKNPLAYSLYNADYIYADGTNNPEGGKYQDVFISHLKNYNDPRLKVLSVVYVDGTADTSASIQKGMPATLSSKPSDFVTYSEPNQNTILKLDGPLYLLGVAEVRFLLAEAALRGWYTQYSAETLYQDGITAAMERWANYGSYGVISTSDIAGYISAHPLNTSGTMAEQLEQIYTELWVELVTDPVESFTSYRRTGYPALTPNNYTGNITGGKIFRRMLYPVSEQNLNAENYNTAIANQGADDFLTRIWWDVEN